MIQCQNFNWNYEPTVNDYQMYLFHLVMDQHCDGYYYCPIAVASQQQIGIKHRYLCIAKPWDSLNCNSHLAEVEIYKPVAGNPYATILFRIDFNDMFFQHF
ncbi:MAG TPA: hypothetical protein GXX75_24195 [Clostridiales bacterium]|nr:hypothetical protein [Clostridiales bacterium]